MEIEDEITSFVDGQLNDKRIKTRMRVLIDTNSDIRNEYLIQKSVKTLLLDRFTNTKTLHCPLMQMFRKK
jgi:hypothetical protein